MYNNTTPNARCNMSSSRVLEEVLLSDSDSTESSEDEYTPTDHETTPTDHKTTPTDHKTTPTISEKTRFQRHTR